MSVCVHRCHPEVVKSLPRCRYTFGMFSGVVVLLFVIQWDACGAVCCASWGGWGGGEVGGGGAAAVLSVGDSLSVATAPGSV